MSDFERIERLCRLVETGMALRHAEVRELVRALRALREAVARARIVLAEADE
jgi:hypothetical protein